MTATELRLLSEALSWHVGQTFTPQHKATFAQAAELIDLLAWAEGENIDIYIEDGEVRVQYGMGNYISPTLIDTLRRAREAAR